MHSVKSTGKLSAKPGVDHQQCTNLTTFFINCHNFRYQKMHKYVCVNIQTRKNIVWNLFFCCYFFVCFKDVCIVPSVCPICPTALQKLHWATQFGYEVFLKSTSLGGNKKCTPTLWWPEDKPIIKSTKAPLAQNSFAPKTAHLPDN